MIIKKNTILLISLTVLFLVSPTVVFAGADSGFYIGLGVGDAKVKSTNLNKSETAGKIFGGYNFGIIPLVDVAVEAAYINFGNASEIINGVENSVDIAGTTAYGLVAMKLGPIGVFAKAGVIDWSSDIVINNVKTSGSGNDAAYGIGAKVQLNSLAVRAEYEVFDISQVDKLTMLSLNVVYTF